MKSLDEYDDRPREMVKYLQYNGWHFNRKMCDFATSKMYKNGRKLEVLSKDQVDQLLKKSNLTLENNQLWDYVYVANMAKADFFGSSLTSDNQIAHFIKDYIDDEDAYDGMPFSRFYIDTVKKGVPIDWEEML